LTEIVAGQDPNFRFTLLNASCKCLEPAKAHECLLLVVRMMPQLVQTAIPLCVDCLLTLVKKIRTGFDASEFAEIAKVIAAKLATNLDDIYRFFEAAAFLFREADVSLFLGYLSRESNVKAGRFLLLLFQQLNQELLTTEQWDNASQLKDIDTLWAAAFSSLPDDQILSYLCMIYSKAKHGANRKIYLTKCGDRLDDARVLRCILSMMDNVECFVDKKV
jgi:hypothetical protein